MDIFNWLNNSKLVSDFTINDIRRSNETYYLNLKIIFIDNSELFIRDYVDLNHRKYSFHWQDNNGELIKRWDNAPHFVDLITFPHHVHLSSENVIESHDISLEEVLNHIAIELT